MKKLIAMNGWFPYAIAAIFAGAVTSCASAQIKSGQVSSGSNSNVIERNPNIQERTFDGGRMFVKAEGWQIPDFSSGEVERSTYKTRTKDGRKIDILVGQYDLKPYIVTDEPFLSIGDNLGKIQIRTIREFRSGSRPFCYKFQVNRVSVDNEANVVISSHGVSFFFSYYDEDGDGKFETLVLDEKDAGGIISFSSSPHLPKWVSP